MVLVPGKCTPGESSGAWGAVMRGWKDPGRGEEGKGGTEDVMRRQLKALEFRKERLFQRQCG